MTDPISRKMAEDFMSPTYKKKKLSGDEIIDRDRKNLENKLNKYSDKIMERKLKDEKSISSKVSEIKLSEKEKRLSAIAKSRAKYGSGFAGRAREVSDRFFNKFVAPEVEAQPRRLGRFAMAQGISWKHPPMLSRDSETGQPLARLRNKRPPMFD